MSQLGTHYVLAQGGPGRGVPSTWSYELGGRCRGDGEREGHIYKRKEERIKGAKEMVFKLRGG